MSIRTHSLRMAITAGLTAVLLGTPMPAAADRRSDDLIGGVPAAKCSLPETATPDIGAAAGILVTPDGREVWARSCDKQRAMASITKVMTALIVLERAELGDTVTVSAAAAKQPYAIGLESGEQLSVRELLELALVASSNDAAQALAEHVGGSVPAFAALMNDKASELGLDDTHFVNPHGLDAAGHHSSARDLARLSRVAMRDPEFRRIVAMDSVTLSARGKRKAEKLEATDELLGEYQGLLGVKTGYTADAGYSFVSSAERDGLSLTAVILGTPSERARFQETKKLLDWGFEHLRIAPVTTTTETIGEVTVAENPERTVPLRFAETSSAVLFDLDGELTRTVSALDSVSLPVFAGQVLGTAKVSAGTHAIGSFDVVAGRDVASAAETVGAVPVSDYLDRTVLARAGDEEVAVAEFDPDEPVERTVALDAGVKAPVAPGTRVGEIRYTQGGLDVATVPVVTVERVEAPAPLERVSIWLARAWRRITGAPTVAASQVFQPATP